MTKSQRQKYIMGFKPSWDSLPSSAMWLGYDVINDCWVSSDVELGYDSDYEYVTCREAFRDITQTLLEHLKRHLTIELDIDDCRLKVSVKFDGEDITEATTSLPSLGDLEREDSRPW